MKIIPKTKKDFAWVNFTPKEIREYTKKVINNISRDAEKVKKIPKEERNFENTILAIDQMGESNSEDSPVSFLLYVSTDAGVRKASAEFQEKVSKKAIDISFDKGLYEAFKEYDKSKEKLSVAETRLYDHLKRGFENQGFHLPLNKQKELKEVKKKLATLGIKFTKNIDSYHDQILCTQEELKGLPEAYISNLKIDTKSKKYIITLAHSEMEPFMKFADSNAKRQELADKSAQRGGIENIKILQEILKLRKQESRILGYPDFVSMEVKDLIAKNPKNIKDFLLPTIAELKIRVDKELNALQDFVTSKYPGNILKYFNTSYYGTKMKENLFAYDQILVKEYFELENVLQKMFGIFGSMFGISFKENRELPTWHPSAKIFDVIENKKPIGHIGFDLYPRKNKYSHFGCAAMLAGRSKKFRDGNEYLAPLSVIIGNFPNGTKENPSLLSIYEIEIIFHEFGHALHGVLSRSLIASQSGTNVVHDFVETPSQLFENWMKDEKNLKSISSHFKTKKKISDELLGKVIKSANFMKAAQYYHTFVISLQDFEMHSDKWNIDPLKLSKEFNKKYNKILSSPKSLFPADWNHMIGYEAKYYSYMWALVYSYDIFSRFKKEGIMNKKVGMELRRKILEKGDSEDALKLMTDFLGRKPNNKAFLEALK